MATQDSVPTRTRRPRPTQAEAQAKVEEQLAASDKEQIAGEIPQPAQKEAPKVVEPIQSNVEGVKPARNRKNRQTGTVIHMFKPVAPGNTWVVQCVDHGTEVHFNTRKAAKASVYIPASWCAACETKLTEAKAEVARKAQEAKDKAAAPKAESVPATA